MSLYGHVIFSNYKMVPKSIINDELECTIIVCSNSQYTLVSCRLDVVMLP